MKETKVRTVLDSSSAEDVANIMKKYDLVVVPVVNENNTLLGRITIDDIVDVISELPEEKQEEVIALLEDEEQASDIIDLLTYEEGTAGALMGKELIS